MTCWPNIEIIIFVNCQLYLDIMSTIEQCNHWKIVTHYFVLMDISIASIFVTCSNQSKGLRLFSNCARLWPDMENTEEKDSKYAVLFIDMICLCQCNTNIPWIQSACMFCIYTIHENGNKLKHFDKIPSAFLLLLLGKLTTHWKSNRPLNKSELNCIFSSFRCL